MVEKMLDQTRLRELSNRFEGKERASLNAERGNHFLYMSASGDTSIESSKVGYLGTERSVQNNPRVVKDEDHVDPVLGPSRRYHRYLTYQTSRNSALAVKRIVKSELDLSVLYLKLW